VKTLGSRHVNPRDLEMTDFISFHRPVTLGALASVLVLAPALLAQATPRSTAARDTNRLRLDTAAILASARPEIDAANAAWLPGLRQHDAKAIAAPYADSGLFIAGDGTVTRGRVAVARMYEARFPQIRPIRAGGIVQDGLTVLSPTRIAEWGHGWIDMEPEREGAPPVRSGGSYLTVWERQADGHWRIVRNLAL
jgi:uncharacterized protein (TIGR02246 family)